MASVASIRKRGRIDYWPGFVDVLATLLLVFVFLLSVFALSQFFLSQEITGRDAVVDQLREQLAELNEMFALGAADNQELTDSLALLQADLAAAEEERDDLQGLLDLGAGEAQSAADRITQLNDQIAAQQLEATRSVSQIELLNQQLAALRRQIGALEQALEASESRDREAQTTIADLGRRLNVALAQRVQELSRYRSDFFGRLREILGSRPGIQIVGDRFVVQAEVLFPSGSDQLNPAALGSLEQVALAVRELEAEIPADIAWVLRVDGHTDNRPLSGSGQFADNWELSAARAISVVQFMIASGVQPNHLVAAGFGEFQPISTGNSDAELAQNRRIEFKITDR
jgi:chemotaxis protein MotB